MSSNDFRRPSAAPRGQDRQSRDPRVSRRTAWRWRSAVQSVSRPTSSPITISQSKAICCLYREMALSARNQLPGIVEEVRLGEIMAHIVVKVGESTIESVITRTSAEELKLKKGDSVRVVVKSTEVMIQKD